jgi:hypothetical protein
MKSTITLLTTVLFATIAVSIAGDKETIIANEKAAWQAFKDKNAEAFKKIVDKDLRAVYADGILNLQQELDAMNNRDIKSFTLSDFEAFTDEPDVMVLTYKAAVQATDNGKDISGTYNAGSVWKKENGAWMGIFHTDVKVAPQTGAAASP